MRVWRLEFRVWKCDLRRALRLSAVSVQMQYDFVGHGQLLVEVATKHVNESFTHDVNTM